MRKHVGGLVFGAVALIAASNAFALCAPVAEGPGARVFRTATIPEGLPARDSVESARANAFSTCGSRSASTLERGTIKRRPCVGNDVKGRGGSPASTASQAAQSSTELASGPTESSV